jgi:glycosyltransferase involved in cell wall biosynthesis
VKISVITVVYNGADTIRTCLDSVTGQTHPDVEYIVIDGNSTDETVTIVTGYRDRIARLVSEPDKGLYDAMNKGIGLATGEVIAFLNADDFYPNPHVLAHVAESFARHTDTDAVYGDMLYVDRTDIRRVTRYWNSGPYRPGAFCWGWMPGHLAFFAKRSVYAQYGGFRLDLRSAADYELMLRFIHKHGIRLTYRHEVFIVMRNGGMSNNGIDSHLKANGQDRQAWQLNNMRPYFFTMWLKPLRKVGQYLRPVAPPDTGWPYAQFPLVGNADATTLR